MPSKNVHPKIPSQAGPDLLPLPMTSLNPEEPPTLVLWLNACLEHIAEKELRGVCKTCIICERPMCDFQFLRRVQLLRFEQQRRKAQQQGAIAAKNPPKSDVDLETSGNQAVRQRSKTQQNRATRQTTWEQPAVMDTTQARLPPPPSHTCDPTFRSVCCELPIKIWTEGCEHVVGHACLERWILDGYEDCPLCDTMWFKKAEKSRITMAESYTWLTNRDMLRPGDLDVTSEYTGRLDMVGKIVSGSLKRAMSQQEGGEVEDRDEGRQGVCK